MEVEKLEQNVNARSRLPGKTNNPHFINANNVRADTSSHALEGDSTVCSYAMLFSNYRVN